MFNVGGGELIVILLIALIVLGPQRLPDAARQLGKAMGDLRRLSTGFQTEMKQALETADDPNRVAGRRNVLATETPTTTVDADAADAAGRVAEPAAEVVPDSDAVTDSIAAVSAQPSAPPKATAPAAEARSAARKRTGSVDPEPPPPHPAT
jgi:sec-independent protein translocase protein TatB